MFDKLGKIGLDEIYWLIKLGMPKRKATIYDIRQNPGEYIKEPVFFLSTGRSGTKWFSELLKKDNNNAVFHNPVPGFAAQSKLVFEILTKRNKELTDEEEKLIYEIFFSGREQHLRYTYKTKKKYIETNNYITFFTPVLYQIFPDAKFIHLIRHPGEFIRSGLQRGYYSGNSSDEAKRIIPSADQLNAEWENYNQIRKISWLWLQTNLFIEKCLSDIPSKQKMVFNFNELSVNRVSKVLTFVNSDLPKNKIKKRINKKVNTQNFSSVASYTEWPDIEKDIVRKICSSYARKYGYIL